MLKDEKLAENAFTLGEVLREGLRVIQAKYPDVVTTVRGKGLLNAVIIKPTAKVRGVAGWAAACMDG